jgi:hypothetical protein
MGPDMPERLNRRQKPKKSGYKKTASKDLRYFSAAGGYQNA